MTQVAERNDTDIVEQGVWFAVHSGKPPVYVNHTSHIKRLVSEGARMVADPRLPGTAAPAMPVETEEELRARIAELQEQLARQAAETNAAAREGFATNAPKQARPAK